MLKQLLLSIPLISCICLPNIGYAEVGDKMGSPFAHCTMMIGLGLLGMVACLIHRKIGLSFLAGFFLLALIAVGVNWPDRNDSFEQALLSEWAPRNIFCGMPVVFAVLFIPALMSLVGLLLVSEEVREGDELIACKLLSLFYSLAFCVSANA